MDEYDEEFSEDFKPERIERMTNVERVVQMMEYSPHGALAQAFIMDALVKWTAKVSQATPAQIGHNLPFAPEAWISVAKDLKRQLDEHFGQ